MSKITLEEINNLIADNEEEILTREEADEIKENLQYKIDLMRKAKEENDNE